MTNADKLPPWVEAALLPVLSLVAALVISGGVVAAAGESPLQAFRLMADGAFGSQEGIGYTLFYATNFIFTGLAFAIAVRAGLFNIGAEGQAYVGGLGTGLVCLAGTSWPSWIVIPCAVITGAIFGGFWALIPAWLQARRGSHVVITTIMFNFIASALMTYLLVDVLIKPGQQSPESREFAVGAMLPPLLQSSPLNGAFILAVAALLLYWIFFSRTRWGYALKVAGANPAAAAYAKIDATRSVLLSMVLSGAAAGLLGVNELMGSERRITLDFPGGAGYVGIAVALMGRGTPIGIFLAAVLFGALYQGGSQLTFDMPRVNRDLVIVIQGLVILQCGAMENLFRRPLGRILAWKRT